MELRMIKPGWKHPTDGGSYSDGSPRYIGLLSRARLHASLKLFEAHNLPSDYDPADYMPDWAPGEATRFVMYETVSEGTPVSPDFATAEELARWLALNPSRFVKGTYQQWMSTIQQGSAFHGIIAAETGVLEAKTLHPTEQPVNIRITKIVSKTEMTFFCPASLYRRMKSLANTRMEVELTETSPENYTATVSEEEWPQWATMAMSIFQRVLTDLIEKIDLELQLASVPE